MAVHNGRRLQIEAQHIHLAILSDSPDKLAPRVVHNPQGIVENVGNGPLADGVFTLKFYAAPRILVAVVEQPIGLAVPGCAGPKQDYVELGKIDRFS